MKRIVMVAALLFAGFFSTDAATSKKEFEAAFQQSQHDQNTTAGKRYTEEFALKAFVKIAGDAMSSCENRRDTVEPAMLVFIVSADGKIKKVLSTPGIEYGECVASKLRIPSSVPRPPHDNFAVAMGVANHSHAEKNAPVDKPIAVQGNDAITYDKGIAPYVAKARASYPAAKKRFLAGLPRGWNFYVSYRLSQRKDSAKEFRFEDVLVEVDSIKNGTVHGRIANQLGAVTNYKYQQAISFPESDVMNWLFTRPDGSEEGNILGNFLDHYKPK